MLKLILINMIRFYQNYISCFLPPVCRFCPSCSEYAIKSLEKYGILKGGLNAIWRILRCNPFSRGGYDPVE
ncbi:MAG TPA: membrane protein insertion efficiency factor YidD [Candidatus Eremiobacteraeota bacterium]|nr:membrane protein insertion efficiency factor YidD [Candidatus Eremiobacteraeota bacterium]